jgi:2-keto-3-deoxy-L-arabinonate dehydratase
VSQIPLRGCIPILCTPFTEDNEVDHDSLRREIDWVIAEGAAGVATLAIASEGYKLTEAERDAVTETVVAHTAGRVPVVVSADGAGTEVALDRVRRAATAGADALMVLPPYFVKPDPTSLFDYYRRIGKAVSIPVIIQDAPQLTGVAMGPALWTILANAVETIRYVKAEGTPQGATLTETIRQSDGKLAVFCGWGGLGMLDALERGAGGSMPAANATRLFADVQRLYEAGHFEASAARFHSELPFILWTMQSVDYSVRAAKEELARRGVFRTALQRQPAAALDEVTLGQLDRWLDQRLSR